jgi:predicted transcriptional regulator
MVTGAVSLPERTCCAYNLWMADPASIFDFEDEDAEEQALLEAEAQLDSGQGVDHVEVAAWLDELAKGNRLPPPKCG